MSKRVRLGWHGYRNSDNDLPIIEMEKSFDREFFPQQIVGNKLYFYSDISRESVFTLNKQIDDTVRFLKMSQFNLNLKETPDIDLHISSDGGEVFPGLASVDKIINCQVPINTHCEGIVASAATLLSVVGKHRTITQNASMLIHQVSGGFWGNFAQFKDEISNMELMMSLIKNIYLKHTKLTTDDLDDLLKHDLCLNAEQCLKRGLVDEII